MLLYVVSASSNDNLCHEIVYHKHEELNYEIMTENVIDLIVDLLQ